MEVGLTAVLVVSGGVLYSLLYRFRGGYPPTGSTQLVRSIFSLLNGLFITGLTYLIGYTEDFTLLIHIGSLISVATFLGLLISHGEYYDMGRQEGSGLHDFYMMYLIGIIRICLFLLPVCYFAVGIEFLKYILVLALTHPVAYEIGWRLPYNQNIGIINAPTAWGELIYGFMVWTGLVWIFIL